MYLPIYLLIFFFIFSCVQRNKSIGNDSLTEIYFVPVFMYNRNISCPCVYLQEKCTLSLCVSATKMHAVPVCIYSRNIPFICAYLQQKCFVPVCICDRNISCPCVYL